MKKINFTAVIIIILFTSILSLLFWMVKTSIANPVQLENMYMNDYHYVDRNYVQIKEDEKTFDAKYKFKILNDNLKVGENKISFRLKDNNNQIITNAKVTFILTTPYTNDFNKDYNTTFQNDNLTANVNIEKAGRWIFIVKINIGTLNIFKHIEKFAK